MDCVLHPRGMGSRAQTTRINLIQIVYAFWMVTFLWHTRSRPIWLSQLVSSGEWDDIFGSDVEKAG